MISTGSLFIAISHAQTAKVFLLAGQSNMAGHGVSDELDPSLHVGPDNVKIWATYQGTDSMESTKGWVPVTPDFGDWSPPGHPEWFGPEVPFADKLRFESTGWGCNGPGCAAKSG